MNPELTICTVYHSPQTMRELERNYDLVKVLNPGVPFRWIVADNRPKDADFEIDGKKFEVYEGAGDEYWGYKLGWGSMRNGTGLNKLFPRVNSRFVLALDPDFYIVRSNWIRDVLIHMKERNLAFFGSTWHPKRYTKYRYFPSVHCFFVDCQKVPARELNFLPGFGDPRKKSVAPEKKKKRAALPPFLKRIADIVTFKNRAYIGDSRDTGWMMYEKFFGREDLKYELCQATYKPWRDQKGMARALYVPNAAIEFFLPDRRCFIPKKKNYYSTVRFSDLGFPDIAGSGWEEFVWQGRPFGFHLFGSKAALGYQRADGGTFEEDFEVLEHILNAFHA